MSLEELTHMSGYELEIANLLVPLTKMAERIPSGKKSLSLRLPQKKSWRSRCLTRR